MKIYEVPLTLAEYVSDMKIKACTQKSLSFVARFCAYNLLRYQVSVYGTIGTLVSFFSSPKYRLLAHVRTALLRQFKRVPLIYVSKQKIRKTMYTLVHHSFTI